MSEPPCLDDVFCLLSLRGRRKAVSMPASMVLWPGAWGLGGSAAATRAAGDKRQEAGDHVFGSRHVVLRLALSWIHRIFDLWLMSPCMAHGGIAWCIRLENRDWSPRPQISGLQMQRLQKNAASASTPTGVSPVHTPPPVFLRGPGGGKGQSRSMSGSPTPMFNLKRCT